MFFKCAATQFMKNIDGCFEARLQSSFYTTHVTVLSLSKGLMLQLFSTVRKKHQKLCRLIPTQKNKRMSRRLSPLPTHNPQHSFLQKERKRCLFILICKTADYQLSNEKWTHTQPTSRKLYFHDRPK